MTDYKVFNDKERATKTFIYGKEFSPKGLVKPVSTDLGGHINIRSVQSQFDRVVTAERTPLIELKSTYGLSVLRDSVTTSLGGGVSNDGTEYLLATDSSANSTAILESSERGRYIPGNTGICGIGIRFPDAPTGTQEVKWGYYDDDNGFFFGQDSTGIFVAIRRNGVTNKVYQDSWNADKLNGTDSSGLTLDLSNGNIFNILYTWYGYGSIEFRVLVGDSFNVQNSIVVHRFRSSEETSVADPNLPIRAEVNNGNTTTTPITLYVGGRQYSIFGRYEPEHRITSESRFTFSVGTTIIPAISFRRKEFFPSGTTRDNSVSVKLEGVEIITDQDVLWEIIFSPTLTGENFTNVSGISANETAVLVDTQATSLSGGEKIFSGLAGGGFFFSRTLSTQDKLNIDFNGLQPVTLAMRGITTSANVTAVFRVREEW